ncbi:MAG: 2-dehydropantoate 2-reductase N-terminal domain-containing protein [Candidatus Tectomicrobia bacterium]
MRIPIGGTGGVGGYFGGRFAAAGEDVVFLARGDYLRAIRETGLHIESDKGDVVISSAQTTDEAWVENGRPMSDEAY